jgi:hypothetical protein
MTSTYWPNDTRVECPFHGLQAVSINDLMWSDLTGSLTLQDATTSARGYAYPASQLTDQSSLTLNQAYFGPRFLGVAKEAMTVTQNRDKILVDRVYVGPMTIESGTYYQGQLVACVEKSSATQLENAKIVVTTTVADAIGYILKDSGGAVTTVTVMLISRVLPCFSLVQQVLNSAGVVMDSGANIAICTTTGTKIGTGATQLIGFWDATPVDQPDGAGQAVVTASTGAALAMTVAPSSPTTGAALNTEAIQNTGITPWGFTTNAAGTDAVTRINTLRVDMLAHNAQLYALNTDVRAINTQINLMRTDVLAICTLLAKLRVDLIQVGLIKGSA